MSTGPLIRGPKSKERAFLDGTSERAMYCAISGEVPHEPVVSSASGHLFERRLIEKALEASSGVCPATGVELTMKQLIPVKADLAVRPRPLTATSLPGLLVTTHTRVVSNAL